MKGYFERNAAVCEILWYELILGKKEMVNGKKFKVL